MKTILAKLRQFFSPDNRAVRAPAEFAFVNLGLAQTALLENLIEPETAEILGTPRDTKEFCIRKIGSFAKDLSKHQEVVGDVHELNCLEEHAGSLDEM